MDELFADPDPQKAKRAMEAMFGMRKLDMRLCTPLRRDRGRISGRPAVLVVHVRPKARIPTEGKVQRLYELEALRTILLIKRSLASGRTLAAAVAALPSSGVPSGGEPR